MQAVESTNQPLAYFTEVASVVGALLIGVRDNRVDFLEFVEADRDVQLKRLKATLGADVLPGECDLLASARQQMTQYFAGTRQRFDLPLSFNGTPFQNRVWQALIKIPYGETCSYGDIARQVGQPQAMRAVGAANGRNHIPIIIPCHRVVNSNGSLGGFSAGLWRKQKLLELEARTTALI